MSIAEFSKKFHADKRGNCAMAVAYGYARATGKSEEEAVKAAEMFRAFGGGKAPDGLCGALYAAKMMQPDHAESIEEMSLSAALRAVPSVRKSARIRLSRATDAWNLQAKRWIFLKNNWMLRAFCPQHDGDVSFCLGFCPHDGVRKVTPQRGAG